MDAIFKAMGDPARRTLLDSLRRKNGQTLQELQTQLEMTRFGVMKHLSVLEEAGLVVAHKRGRFKHHYLNVLPLQQAIDHWIDPLIEKPSARAVLNLKSQLESPEMTVPAPDFVMQTFIETTHDRLWDALTKGDLAAQYHFACDTVRGDLSASGDRQSFLLPDGSRMLDFELTAIDPKSRIELTFEPHFFGPDAPASKCVYLVEASGDAMKLTIEHYNIPQGQDGVGEGWARLASALKSFLEVGPARRFGYPLG
ncbi:ArsR family transcriptional regulator [Shimia isoporae]|uniref:ArsR family transcriptional regulator n=1 Tax=Shimia isoporae TaxID=647720 RepID=A0A4R1NL56_9RHOB|nr:SRPBCC domain-containing protein [Shimia isoporae]TCL08984.1 ArsR family transcriptional regulator [Shimia isoporae]